MKYFGTDGIRGRVNVKLGVELSLKTGQALGYINNAQKKKIIIGYDTRESCTTLASVFAGGVSSFGHDVDIVGVVSTPGLSYLTNKFNYDYGVMISASHNPYYDNGIKIFDKQGRKISSKVEKDIEQVIDSGIIYHNSNCGLIATREEIINEYIKYLKGVLPFETTPIKVVVDCSNGANFHAADIIFKGLNNQNHVIAKTPNGKNINDGVGSTHIENLQKYMETGDFDIGFSFDGDGDRIIMVDKNGNIVDGDKIIYLLALKYKKENNLPNNSVVMTVMTNLGVINSLNKNGVKVVIAPVGDKYVSRELEKNNLILGGEQSGHIIDRNYANSGDGLLIALLLMDFVSNNNNYMDILSEIKINPQMTTNIQVEDKEKIIESSEIISLNAQTESELKNNGRVLVRASGTEELIRVMVEAQNESECERITSKYIDTINKIKGE